MHSIQFDMFIDKGPLGADEAYIMRQELEDMRSRLGRQQKAAFAKIGAQGKDLALMVQKVLELEAKLEMLKSA